MNKLKTVYAIIFMFLFLLINGCASPLQNYAQNVIDNYQASIEKQVRGRTAQISFRIACLNEDMLKYKFDEEKVEEITAERTKLRDEQRFLYTLSFEQFKLDYDVVEEYENKDGLRRLIVRVEGKTHIVNKDGRSEVIEIPEEARYWFFSEYEYNDKIQIAGPLAVPPKKLKELTENKDKSPEPGEYTVTESTSSEDS